MRRNNKDRLRRAQEAELKRVVEALAANERNYQQAGDELCIPVGKSGNHRRTAGFAAGEGNMDL